MLLLCQGVERSLLLCRTVDVLEGSNNSSSMYFPTNVDTKIKVLNRI